MEELDKIRRLVPNMPDEVWQWFSDRIDANGWPPVGATWRGALRNRPFSCWQQLDWRLDTIQLDAALMHPKTLQIVNGLTSAHFLHISNEYSAMTDSPDRLASITDYVNEYGCLPSPLIFLVDGDMHELVDGCHRMTVYAAMRRNLMHQISLESTTSAWIGYLDAAG